MPYTFIYDEDKKSYSENFSDENITMSFTAEVTLDEILSKFERFLQGCGFQWIEPESIQYCPPEKNDDKVSFDDYEYHSYSTDNYIFNPDDFHYPYDVSNLNISLDDNITYTTDFSTENKDQLSFDFTSSPYEYGDVTFSIGDKEDKK